MKRLGDKERVWLSHELAEREEIAASAAKEIASSEYPRDVVRRYMPKLVKYEILPNIVWDGMSDDEIREFAKTKISPPGRLSKVPDFNHYNKKPLIPVFECIMLAIDVEPGTPIRTQTEREEYGRILDLAISYGRAKKKPFADWNVGTFGKYQIEPKRFIKWLKLMGKHPPEEWQPISGTIERGGLCWEEACMAREEMRDNPAIGVPRNQEQLYCYMLKPENKEHFPNCCDGLDDWLAVKKRVYRERKDNKEATTDPLEDHDS